MRCLTYNTASVACAAICAALSLGWILCDWCQIFAKPPRGKCSNQCRSYDLFKPCV